MIKVKMLIPWANAKSRAYREEACKRACHVFDKKLLDQLPAGHVYFDTCQDILLTVSCYWIGALKLSYFACAYVRCGC